MYNMAWASLRSLHLFRHLRSVKQNTNIIVQIYETYETFTYEWPTFILL